MFLESPRKRLTAYSSARLDKEALGGSRPLYPSAE